MKDKRTLAARCLQLVKSKPAAHLLSEAGNFWQVASHEYDGKRWIYGTMDEFCDRFGLTASSYKSALKSLKDEGLIEVEHGPHPLKRHLLHTTFITLRADVIEALQLRDKRKNQGGTNPTVQMGEKSQTPLYKKSISEKSVKNSEKFESEVNFSSYPIEGQEEIKEKIIQFRKLWEEGHQKFERGIAPQWTPKDVTRYVIPLIREAKELKLIEDAINSSFEGWDDYQDFVQKHLGWDKNIAGTPTLAFIYASRKAWFDYPNDPYKAEIAKLDAMFTNKLGQKSN